MMKGGQKQTRLKKIILGFLLLLTLAALNVKLNQHNLTYAKTNYTRLANYKIKSPWWTQGATITKNYVVYTEQQLEKHVGNNPSTKVVRCERANLKKCIKSKAYKWGHILTLSHKWDTDYFLVRSDHGKNSACWSVSKFKIVSMSKCSWKDNGTPRLRMRDYGGKNGYANQGKYYLRVYGTGHTKNLHIVLYDSSKVKNGRYKKIYDTKLPSSMQELEDIMIDQDTGVVYFTSVHGGSNRSYQLNKLNDPTISKYIKPLGATNSNSGNNSGSNSSSGTNSNSTSNIATVPRIEPQPTNTVFFGEIGSDNSACGIFNLLNLIINIFSITVGVLALIGITIVGIQYLTAKGNEEQTRKAKHRMLQIVIGLALYASIWALTNFLMPGGSFNPLEECAKEQSLSSKSIC